MSEPADIRGRWGCLATALVYVPLAFMLSTPFVMGECIPRDDPNVAICDAQKQADVLVYTGLFLISPLIAGLLVWRKSWRAGSIYLLTSSLLPFLVVLGMNLAR